MLNTRESRQCRVIHRNKSERSESTRIEQLEVGHRNKRRERIQPYPGPQAENHRMTNRQRRANAIRRESGDNRARLRGIVLRILSNKAKPEPRQPYLENQVENHHPSNGQRRVVSRKESEHSYARYRSVARMQRSITETINEKLRERTLPYAATIVYSGVDAPNIKRGHELPCQTSRIQQLQQNPPHIEYPTPYKVSQARSSACTQLSEENAGSQASHALDAAASFTKKK